MVVVPSCRQEWIKPAWAIETGWAKELLKNPIRRKPNGLISRELGKA
jgi:hypothetical protein